MDADNVTAWSKGGATDLSNLTMLCQTQPRQGQPGKIAISGELRGTLSPTNGVCAKRSEDELQRVN